MTNEILLKATLSDEGIRLDKFISDHSEVSRSFAQSSISSGRVMVNGKYVSKSCKLHEGDEVSFDLPEPEPVNIEPQDIPLDIRYEDNDLLVVNKCKGMVVHPAPGNSDHTLVNALLAYCGDSLSGINGILRPGIVHRIDKDTSGLLIVAKNDFAHRGLAEQIKEHSFTRKYQAVVYGNIKEDSFTIDLPIGRHPKDRKKMAVTDKNSRNAVTHVRVIGRYNGFTHVELTLETGRTHQIRVHMAYIGHPVAGDVVYGPKKNVIKYLNGQCLHAYYISFEHPRDKRTITVETELPKYFKSFLEKLRALEGQ